VPRIAMGWILLINGNINVVNKLPFLFE
jgi:hypothetical protein